MDTQCQGYGRVPNCISISIASSCWQYTLPWAASEGAFRAGTFWSVQTTRWPLRISTGKPVYAPIACYNSHATISSGVQSICGPFMPSISQECLIRCPTCSTFSGRPVCISRNHPLPVVLLPIRGNARHGCTGTHWHPRACANMRSPQWVY